MKKLMIPILAVLIFLAGCDQDQLSQTADTTREERALLEEENSDVPVEPKRESVQATAKEQTTKPEAETLVEDEQLSDEEIDAILEEIKSKKLEEEKELSLVAEKGCSLMEETLVGIFPMEEKDDVNRYMQDKDLDIQRKDFRVLLFSTMHEEDVSEFLLVPHYANTRVKLYELTENEFGEKVTETEPTYSYTLDKDDVVLLRLPVAKEDPEYIVKAYHNVQEAYWMPVSGQQDPLCYALGFEVIE